MRWFTRCLFAVVALAVLASPIAAESTPVATPQAHPSCADLDAYVEDVVYGTFRDLSEKDQEVIREFVAGELDPMEERPSRLRAASDAFDHWASALDDIDPRDVPLVAEDYHAQAVKNLSVLSTLLNAIATSGPMAAIGYADQAEAFPAEWDAISDEGQKVCGDAWSVLGDELMIPPER